MTPGRRGWILLLCLVSVAALAGWSAGGAHTGAKWQRWTHESVNWQAKADRK